MPNFFEIRWLELFVPEHTLELILRGTIVYLGLFTMLRIVQRRQAGTVAITDLLVVVLIADAAQNAMSADYNSVTDGLILVATIIFWSYALDWLGYRFPRIQRFVYPSALPLIWDGRILYQNLAQELITEEELMSQLRLQGIDDISRVHAAYMEGDGRISVITKEERHTRSPDRTIS